jgi:class 3 adenylate cyclase
MRCAGCGQENRHGRKFCAACGARLAVNCAACGTANEPDEKFCGECGASLAESYKLKAQSQSPAPRPTPKHLADKILQSKSALSGERKHVTVLFADVKGSMELAERMDPEEWSQIMQRVFRILADGVERFEGFVDKFTGDGIMALFGAPIAHEDHAQRACYAALQLRDAVKAYADELRLSRGLDLAVRVGINTGEVVVGTIGDDLRMDYTAQGHTVGLAQRMEQLAAAHSICVSEATAALVSGYMQLRDLGVSNIKGVSQPVRRLSCLGLPASRARPGARRRISGGRRASGSCAADRPRDANVAHDRGRDSRSFRRGLPRRRGSGARTAIGRGGHRGRPTQEDPRVGGGSPPRRGAHSSGARRRERTR